MDATDDDVYLTDRAAGFVPLAVAADARVCTSGCVPRIARRRFGARTNYYDMTRPPPIPGVTRERDFIVVVPPPPNGDARPVRY